MCIAIMKPEGKIIPKKTLQLCYENNPDGAGFMFAQDKELIIKKGYFDFEQFYKAYKKHEHLKNVIHFRIKTHGKINKSNCHPFNINNSIGFVHNGIISNYGDDIKSDTVRFNQQVLQPLVDKWGNLALFHNPVTQLIESTIGYSKLVFLDRHDNHHIMNEQKGEWHKGVWYSNSSYKPKPKIDITTTKPKWQGDWRQSHFNYYGNLYGTPKEQDKLALPASSVGLPVKKSPIQLNDFVELKKDFTDDMGNIYYETEWGEVVGIHNDSVDLMFDDDPVGGLEMRPAFAYNVPLDQVESYDYSD